MTSVVVNSAISLYYAKVFLTSPKPTVNYRYIYTPDFLNNTFSFGRYDEAFHLSSSYYSARFVCNYLAKARAFPVFGIYTTLDAFVAAYARFPKVYTELAVPLMPLSFDRFSGQMKEVSAFSYYFVYNVNLVYQQLFFRTLFSFLFLYKPTVIYNIFSSISVKSITVLQSTSLRTNLFYLVPNRLAFMITFIQLARRPRVRRYKKPYTPRLAGSPSKRATCLKVYTMKPKKPNSAIRKIAKVRLSNGQRTLIYLPGQGHSLQQHSVVMIRGGRVPDLPGIRYRAIRGKYDFSYKESFDRKSNRSKYGTPSGKKKTS